MTKTNFRKVLAVLLAVLMALNLAGCGKEPQRASYGFYGGNVTTSSGWKLKSNIGKLNTKVAAGSRSKFTRIRGNGQDTITIMIYMCGTDLESQYGMATADLVEMTNADISDNINIIVLTGGCKSWNNTIISRSVNQIYQVKSNGVKLLEDNYGNAAMTDPNNLTKFIQYASSNFPANRYELIFWDHGGGTLSGYGYDEKNGNDSMDLSEIRTALDNSGVAFDFIGFDACLMATLETGLMLADHADYLIASEESEPGQGWYYTDWLNTLSGNTSMPTVEIGKAIVDSFITASRKYTNKSLTLSVTDLAELSNTVPSLLTAFSQSTAKQVSSDYRTVSSARSAAREYASHSKIDQVDLVHLASNLGTSEGTALSNAIMEAVKYNYTSSDMTNSYGLSIYFPYRSLSYLNRVLNVYNKIGMDSDYSSCIRSFATMATSGQYSSGGSYSAYDYLSALTGGSSQSSQQSSSSYNYSSQGSYELVFDLLNAFLGGSSSSSQNSHTSSYYDDAFSFLFGRDLDVKGIARYIADNHFDADLRWNKQNKIGLTQHQWDMVSDLELNVMVDDGSGYIDLGLDNVYETDEEGLLKGDPVTTWLSIDKHLIAYYHTYTVDDGNEYTIRGYVPCLYNGERANLILEFTNENPKGVISGVNLDYEDIDVQAKVLESLKDGDQVTFLCDYYNYAGEYQDSFQLGDVWTVKGTPQIGDITVDGKILAMYRFTDIYGRYYWTEPVKQ